MSVRIFVLLPTALLATACIWGRGQDPYSEVAGDGPVTIEVVNENYYDARVHAVYQGGRRLPLGTIAGNGGRSETEISWEPRALTFTINFIVAGSAYVSEPVDAVGGEHLQLRLPPNIESSGFFRRIGGPELSSPAAAASREGDQGATGGG